MVSNVLRFHSDLKFQRNLKGLFILYPYEGDIITKRCIYSLRVSHSFISKRYFILRFLSIDDIMDKQTKKSNNKNYQINHPNFYLLKSVLEKRR